MAKAVLKCDSHASIWALQVPLGRNPAEGERDSGLKPNTIPL